MTDEGRKQGDTTPKLRFYNSITKTCEEFVTRQDGVVKWYVCGPTVYDSAHVGHARTYVSFDVIRRVLSEYFGYHVVYAMNITDIDDKIIKRACELDVGDLEKACEEVATRFEAEFFEDMAALGVKMPTVVVRATKYIEKIRQFVEKLEQQGFAYEANGSVYFDLQKYKQRWTSPVFVGADAIDETEIATEKKHKADFVLWKKAKENEPRYASKWGDGRPGWHIECSTMAIDTLGVLDVHSGGVDLAFPHHENEMAQSQAFLGKERLGESRWSRFFIHTGHLHVEGCKMSKSLKNFVTIRDILKSAGPRTLRMLFLLHNWGSDMEFGVQSLEYARSVEQKIANFLSLCEARGRTGSATEEDAAETGDAILLLKKTRDGVHEALCNNVDTRRAVLLLSDLVSSVRKRAESIDSAVLAMIGGYIRRMCRIFGLLGGEDAGWGAELDVARILCKFRGEVRKFARERRPHSELYKMCDEVREELRQAGYVIEDSGDSSSVRRRV
ncbi:UNVERIFIED_CONTAM: hypothetical protein PYX00_011586 [Menopon gallinae]|uniref:cysteine--tRNA ligase n=1 Tax=Menopon gallinae TaxID=328185 RepID=A0AAW2H7R7_9NEOP